MRLTKKSLVALCVASVAFGSLLLWLAFWSTPFSSENRNGKIPIATPLPNTKDTLIPASKGGTIQTPGGPFEPSDPRWATRIALQKVDPTYEWKTSISFYGVVVDRNQMPVPGVHVKISWTNLSTKGFSETQRVTDEKGLFSLIGVAGKHLGVIELRKAGYTEEKGKNRYSFEYAGFWEPNYFQPDPDNPMVFHVRKLLEPEVLVHHGPTLFAVRGAGGSDVFNLSSGRRTAELNGDISVQIVRGETINRRFDWQVVIRGDNGAGLLESSDEEMSVAPTSGYQPSWTAQFQGNAPAFVSEIQKGFFIRTGQGTYGRISL